MKRKLLPALLAALLLLPAGGLLQAAGEESGEKGSLSLSFDKNAAAVGGSLILTVGHVLPEGGRLTDPLEITGIDDLTILRRERTPSELRVTFLADRLEKREKGPFTLAWTDEDGTRHVIEGEIPPLEIRSNIEGNSDEALPRPLREIVPLRSPLTKYLPWAAAAALLAAALFLFLRFRRRGRGSGAVEETESARPRAEREIERLLSRRIFEKGQVKEFYFRLSEILRRYLESIRSFPAAEYTTEEISRSVRCREDQLLVALLRKADVVKFADDRPTAARKEEEVKGALDYVRMTSPLEENAGGKER